MYTSSVFSTFYISIRSLVFPFLSFEYIPIDGFSFENRFCCRNALRRVLIGLALVLVQNEVKYNCHRPENDL